MGPFLLDEALKEFEKKFKDKTGLAWDDRSAESKPKKYIFIEKSYESDEEDADAEDGHNWNEDMDQKGVSVKSELPIQTQQLMELIFNEYHFNSVLEELGYNTDKLPLGKLGKSTLKKGFEHLRELASLIKNPVLSQNKYGMSQREVSALSIAPFADIRRNVERESERESWVTLMLKGAANSVCDYGVWRPPSLARMKLKDNEHSRRVMPSYPR